MTLHKTFSYICLLFLTIVCLIADTHADAIIQVDSNDFDFGGVREGTIKRLRHTFSIQNKGEDTLYIKKVKPG